MKRTRCSNRVILTGFVGKEFKLKKVKDDISVATFFVGIPYQDGEDDSTTEWETHAVEVWRGLADACKRLTKGSKILVEGALRLNRWTDADNNPQARQYILADRVEFLNLKPKEEKAQEEQTAA